VDVARAAADMTTTAVQVGQTVTVAITDVWFIEVKMEGNRKKLELMDRDTIM
jgi:hypothetical protein